jgi:hypothetical protein
VPAPELGCSDFEFTVVGAQEGLHNQLEHGFLPSHHNAVFDFCRLGYGADVSNRIWGILRGEFGVVLQICTEEGETFLIALPPLRVVSRFTS